MGLKKGKESSSERQTKSTGVFRNKQLQHVKGGKACEEKKGEEKKKKERNEFGKKTVFVMVQVP